MCPNVDSHFQYALTLTYSMDLHAWMCVSLHLYSDTTLCSQVVEGWRWGAAGGWKLWWKDEWESHRNKEREGRLKLKAAHKAIYRADVMLVLLLIIEVVVGVRLHRPSLFLSLFLSLLPWLLRFLACSSLFTPLDLTFTAQLPLRTS